MKTPNNTVSVLWLVIGWPLTALGVVVALTLVFSILGIVSMFIAMAVPFGFAPLVLAWLFRRR